MPNNADIGVTPRATQAFTTAERALVDTLTAIKDPASLLATWRSHQEATWAAMPAAYSTLADRLLAFGDPLLAYDTVAEGLKYAPEDARLRQMLALSLARSGATEKANAVLRQLHDDGNSDEETLGLLASTYKDLWLLSVGNKLDALREARRFYLQSYETTGGYWTGINAATLTAIMGERQLAVSLAERVRLQCASQLEQASASGSDSFWLAATLVRIGAGGAEMGRSASMVREGACRRPPPMGGREFSTPQC